MSTKKQYDLPPDGLWVSPEGEFIPVIEHLVAIREHPDLFGLSERDVRGASFTAMHSIGESLIRDSGWVRYRAFSDLLNIEVDDARQRMTTIEDILFRTQAHMHEKVLIHQATPRKEFEGTVADVFERAILRFQANPGEKNSWRFT